MSISAQMEKNQLVLAAQAVTNGATATANIDTLGADYCKLLVNVALGATATIASADGVTLSVQSSDVTHSSSFATVAANLTAKKTSLSSYYNIECKNRKRYLRLSITPGTSGVSNEVATVAAFAVLSRLSEAPSSTSGMRDTANTNDTVTIVT